MLRVKPELVESVRAAQSAADLYEHIQGAIELEHSTIPPYLTAAFSIKSGRSDTARGILVSVALQEMLHMTIAANLLNAVGGDPVIDRPGFIPLYPGPLPMNVHDGLTVSLQKATRGLVFGTFMTIEEPERPLKLRVKQVQMLAMAAPAAAAPGFPTIGDFYAAIKERLRAFGDGVFARPSNPQLVDNAWFPADQLFAITDWHSAWRAIDIIVEQGEGTHTSPLEHPGGAPSHYYRLAQIAFGRKLVEDKAEPDGYSYSGEEVPLAPEDVWNLYPDAKAVDYAPNSRARSLVERFNFSYTSLLRALHQAFHGRPEMLNEALALMYEIRLLANDIVAAPVAGTPFTAAPTFEYTTVPI